MKKFTISLFTLIFRGKEKGEESGRLFITGEWYILPDQEIDLDRLAVFMKKNPGLKVELNLHKDYSGNQLELQQTWQLKAKEAIDYLVSEGIEKSKLISNHFRYTALPCFRLMSA